MPPYYFNAQGKYGPDWSKFNYIADQSITTTPLSQAIALGNQEIIESIIHAYSNSENLAAIYEQVRATQQASMMRLWIEQQAYLWKGEHVTVADETVKLFLSKSLPEAIQTGNASLIKEYLDHGWLLTQSQATQLLASHDPSMVDLLKNGSYLQQGVNPVMIAAEIGSLDLLKSYIHQGHSLEGILLHAVQNQQKPIIEHLLTLPLSQDEIAQAYAKAYQIHAYDIMILLDSFSP